MRINHLLTAIFAISVLLPGCDATGSSHQEVQAIPSVYNICLVLDGTDRLSEQNGVPCMAVEEILDLAGTLTQKGLGNLYVTYVDDNCDNNRVAVYEWSEMSPEPIGTKPSYIKSTDYEKQCAERQKEVDDYKARKEEALQAFTPGISFIVEAAYSDKVAHQRRCSDVNGAINQASRLLKATASEDNHSCIILVSDGCDNVGKGLSSLPIDTDLFLINSNVSKHQYGDLVTREFVTLHQAIKYIFK